jgi:hypothetical protein
MKRRAATERPTLDLIEEAVHLLRSTPAHVFGWYLLGTLPFFLGLLYFWTDMSWSALAAQHRAEASLGVALLFIWMKTNQAIFAGCLHAQLARRVDERLGVAAFLRVALHQSIVQPSKLFIIPAAALATLPFAWVWAFYENATVLGSDETARKFIARSWRLARFSPRQNHGAISIYLLLYGVVFINLAIVVVLLPQLLKMFTGVESVFTRNQIGLFNSTFFAVVITLTYLVCDPLRKAIYALRCFYAESVHSGADLMAEIRALPRARTGLASAAALLLLAMMSPISAAPPAPPPMPSAESAGQLNHAIEETLKRSEFSWKLPRQPDAQAKSKWPFVDAIGRFLKSTGRFIKRAWNAIFDWIERLFAQRTPSDPRPSGSGWYSASRGWMIALVVVLVIAALALLAKAVQQFRLRKLAALPIAAPAPKVDLEDDAVTADLLPEDEWQALAREHLRQGEMRLALRAFFLSGLAHLAAREVLTLSRHKSNRDYEAELRRRARDQSLLLEAFAANIALVERVWYGQHAVDAEALRDFELNLQRIRAC